MRVRLTTPSSATAERGAVAAWWGEVKAYELEKQVARTRDARTRNSSYRDARSSSLQRMVRRSVGLAPALARGCETARESNCRALRCGERQAVLMV